MMHNRCNHVPKASAHIQGTGLQHLVQSQTAKVSICAKQPATQPTHAVYLLSYVREQSKLTLIVATDMAKDLSWRLVLASMLTCWAQPQMHMSATAFPHTYNVHIIRNLYNPADKCCSVNRDV